METKDLDELLANYSEDSLEEEKEDEDQVLNGMVKENSDDLPSKP